jgi:anti-sigma factor RsiW
MVCEPHERRIKAWLDGELDAASAADVESHVAACASCRARSADFRRLAECIRALASEPAPPPRLAAILAATERSAREERETVRFLRRVALAAAGVLLSSLVVFYFFSLAEPESALAADITSDSVMAVALSDTSYGEDL